MPCRTLVYVLTVDQSSGRVLVRLPNWRNPAANIPVQLEAIPEAVRQHVVRRAWLYARVNIEAENQEDLSFDGWEVKKPNRAWVILKRLISHYPTFRRILLVAVAPVMFLLVLVDALSESLDELKTDLRRVW